MSMTLKELVKGKKVRFRFYRDGELWYATNDGFEFPVPIADTGTGIFQAEDGAIQYMRWIRKHLETRAEGKKNGGSRHAIFRRLHRRNCFLITCRRFGAPSDCLH